MKPILYAGAVLMVGASIYGFADYKKTSHEKQFTTMYNEVKENKTISEKEPVVVKKEISEVNKNQTVKEKISSKQLKQVDKEQAITEKPATTSTSEKTVIPVKIKKSRKKISTKFFSRAPIREEMEEEVVLPVAEKTDKKMEIKKQ